jgi:PAS domain S-box-containing protein
LKSLFKKIQKVKMPSKIPDENQLTQLTKKIQRLETLNRDLTGMMENSFDAVAIVDNESRLLLVNPAFERVMGLKKSEVMGRKISDLVAEGVSDTGASLKVLETGISQTVIINTKSGKQVLSTGMPVFDHNGNITRIFCNLRDVTELNALKERYEQSQKLISKYLLELQEVKKIETMKTFIARSKQMKQVVETAYRLARFDTTVLVLGESGVGKDLVARIIHEASPRMETGVFVKINCGAIPENLLESELFGYKSGAFTGASKEGKPGYFEVADKGTLFLDEIADLPMRLQVKLLSVIQDQEIIRLGDVNKKKVDVRIIAATNQDLEKSVRNGQFREDLYYRLNVVPLSIPPLRKRKEEIPFLLAHYVNQYNKKYRAGHRLSQEVVENLSGYHWPGNVRELANLVEHLIIVTNEPVLKQEHLPQKYVSSSEEKGKGISEPPGSLREELEKVESQLIKRMLARTRNYEEAAHLLGISLSTLSRRIRHIKIDSQN